MWKKRLNVFTVRRNVFCVRKRKGAHSLDIIEEKTQCSMLSVEQDLFQSNAYGRHPCGLRHGMADPEVKTSQMRFSGPNSSWLNQ